MAAPSSWSGPRGPRAKDVWLVVKELSARQRRLSTGSVFRLGRFEFEVRRLVASAQDNAEDLALFRTDTCVPCLPFAEAPSKVCRICLMEGEDGADAEPLVAPCKCSGSVEHVHMGCLQHWVQSKFAVPLDGGKAYKHVAPSCEICKGAFPAQVQVGAERRRLLEIPSVEPPYVVLESRGQRATQRNSPQTFYVVSLKDGKALSIGRSHACDVSVDDVSLSRAHASISFNDGAFVLEDNNSKFGTLLSFSEYRVSPGATVSVQSGCTLLSLSLAASAAPPELLEGQSFSTSEGVGSHLGETVVTQAPSTLGARSSDPATGARTPRGGSGSARRVADCFRWRNCITSNR